MSFARQRWRAWIETRGHGCIRPGCAGSPVSDGGRGLKHFVAEDGLCRLTGSPVSDGGRGLKRIARGGFGTCPGFARQRWRAWIETSGSHPSPPLRAWFARQRWRAWIETHECECSGEPCEGSPVSDGGRGLKPDTPNTADAGPAGFARQRWRAWIETPRSGAPSAVRCAVRPSAMAGVD